MEAILVKMNKSKKYKETKTTKITISCQNICHRCIKYLVFMFLLPYFHKATVASKLNRSFQGRLNH